MPREDIGAKPTDAEEKENKSGNASFQVQDELFNTLQEMSRDWTARATAEVEPNSSPLTELL